MKQGKILKAYKTLAELNQIQGLPFSICCDLFMAKKNLEPYYELQLQKENVLIEASGQSLDNYKLTPEFKKAVYDIYESDVGYDTPPVEIVINDDIALKLGMSADLIERLDGFVTFKGA